MEQNLVSCPGCGVQLSSSDDLMDKDFNASAACRNLYFELTYYTLSLQDSYFIHQLVVDAYAAQHSGRLVKPITTTFALVGLYLVCEKGFSGKQVQNAHMLLARMSKTWPRFDPPKEKAAVTVFDVVKSPQSMKNEMIKKWCQAVWATWSDEHQKIEEIVQKYMSE